MRKFHNNPCGKTVGDCAVRAISVALNIGWYDAYDLLCETGRHMCNMPNADEVWGAVLVQNGFERHAIPRTMTAMEFAKAHPRGVYVLAFGGHVAAVRDGEVWDSWDSSNDMPIYYYRRG